jgi:signal transduction histidine kinase
VTAIIITPMKARLWSVAIAGSLAVAGAALLAAGGVHNRPTAPGEGLTILVGLSLLGSGLASWRARPENRLGPLMIGIGFCWCAGLLPEARSHVLFTIGELLQFLWIAGFFALVLSFPSGRLESRQDRVLVVLALILACVLEVALVLFGDRTQVSASDVLHVFHVPHVAQALFNLQRLLAAVLTVWTIGRLIVRWSRASTPARRAVTPVLAAGGFMFASLIMTAINDLTGDGWGATPAEVFFYAAATVPVAVMLTMLQRRLAQGQVAGLVVQLGGQSAAAKLRGALARALGDPTLQVAYWYAAESRYVDAEGRPLALPSGGSGRRATLIERDGHPVAALVHDPALEHHAELVESVCAAAGLALENERLAAELRARLAELQASRARLVEATDAERRRIERDLHDGTQQRLVSIAMSLGLAETKLPAEPGAAAAVVAEAREALTVALAELRELTQGIHPAVLSERGLGPALEELCGRAALPARLACAIDEPLPQQVEGAAYFLVSEALTNAAKHSHGSEVRVDVRTRDAVLAVEVSDDGIGGAGGAGSGLRGLADRVEALGGRLTVSSPPGRGTVLRAEIPCA